MSKVCQVSGKKASVGNNVSHANNRTKRKFNPNLQSKKFYVPEEDRWVSLRVSTKVVKTISKKGIYAVIKEAKAKGTYAGA